MGLKIKKIEPHFTPPRKGNVLVSEPFLEDYHFRRSVIFVSDHNDEGSVGFVVNRLIDLSTNDVIPGLMKYNFPLFFGGPVEPNTLHFIHKVGDLIAGAQHIANGIYWGGDIEMIDDLIDRNIASQDEFRFFSGYSGWASGQLEDEIQQKSWWVGSVKKDLIFDEDLEHMWRKAVKQMGQDFAYMANAPEDRSWN